MRSNHNRLRRLVMYQVMPRVRTSVRISAARANVVSRVLMITGCWLQVRFFRLLIACSGFSLPLFSRFGPRCLNR